KEAGQPDYVDAVDARDARQRGQLQGLDGAALNVTGGAVFALPLAGFLTLSSILRSGNVSSPLHSDRSFSVLLTATKPPKAFVSISITERYDETLYQRAGSPPIRLRPVRRNGRSGDAQDLARALRGAPRRYARARWQNRLSRADSTEYQQLSAMGRRAREAIRPGNSNRRFSVAKLSRAHRIRRARRQSARSILLAG